MSILANSEDPDKMSHNATFYQGLHCLLRQKEVSEKDVQHCLEIIACDPSNIQIYTIGLTKLLFQTSKEIHKYMYVEG